MSSSVIEQIRQLHEDVESYEKAGSKLFAEKSRRCGGANNVSEAKSALHRQRIVLYDHAVRRCVHGEQNAARQLLDLYADADGLRKEEIALLGGAGGDVWASFYQRLKDTRDRHRRLGTLHSLALQPPLELADPPAFLSQNFLEQLVGTGLSTTVLSDKMDVDICPLSMMFTGEEDCGKRADLLAAYQQFTNLAQLRRWRESEYKKSQIARLRRLNQQKKKKSGSTATDMDINWDNPDIQSKLKFVEIDYITFLKTFDRFHDIPRHCKHNSDVYENYLDGLRRYLTGLFCRQYPLVDLQLIEKKFGEEFETRWLAGGISEWRVPTDEDPLYCMPTDTIFASEGALQGHKNGKKFLKAAEEMSQKSVDEIEAMKEASRAKDKRLAILESKIQRYRELLGEAISRTIESLQKKQSRGLHEMVEEDVIEAEDEGIEIDPFTLLGGDDEVEDDADDVEDKPIYNPLNLPLGWDGKPIPFWLWKLHGLGQEFKCEICGNYSYWGRRAFERHFQEWRHAFGMRCLKIPNTSHFKEITLIEDAIVLYEKLRRDAEVMTFRGDQDVEMEDSEGNVVSMRSLERFQQF